MNFIYQYVQFSVMDSYGFNACASVATQGAQTVATQGDQTGATQEAQMGMRPHAVGLRERGNPR